VSRRTFWNVAVPLLVLAVAHVFLFLPLPPALQPHLVQAVAALILAGFLPGALLVQALVGQGEAPPNWWERIVLSAGAAYVVLVAGMLVVSYLPGGPTLLNTLLVFDAVTLALLAWTAWRGARVAGRAATPWPLAADWRWLLAGALVLLLAGIMLRLGNLGYSDFQGDEARAALRAAAAIQGYEDVLFLHKKGPTEILLPTVLYTLTGHLTEATSRLPFALANLAALFAAWLLGWRLFNPLAGWVAAMFFALDGYFIGFARIVQYQSVVLLMSLLVVLILYRLVQRPQALTGYLTLAALLLATGLLSHYEGALVALPAAVLWGVLLWRERRDWRRIAGATAIAAVVGGVLLGAFYLPYVTNPRFAATYFYLTDRRIGGSPPYNNLLDVFLRTTLYSTTYYVLLLVGLTVAGMLHIFWRGLRRPWHWVAGAATLLLAGATFVNPSWLTVGGRDWIIVPFVLIFGALLLTPRQTLAERVIWLWFAAVMVLALFLTEKPRTHVYTFFIPWLLICGQVAALGFGWLARRFGARPAMIAGSAAAAVLILLFGNYAYRYFVSTDEVMLNYFERRPPGYWVTYAEPDNKARFGFPLNNGWKVIGELYRQGELHGYFDTNEKEAWVPAWYSRGVERCPRDAQWFFEIRNLEPWSTDDELAMEHYLRQGFEKWGKVQVEGRDKMIIYQRTGNHQEFPTQMLNAGLRTFQFEEYAAAFDDGAAPDLPLTYPSVDPEIAFPLNYNFGNLITLEGYDIAYPQPLQPGDTIRLTLYWRGQAPIPANYKVFNQMYAGDGKMQAQRDGYPVCDGRETWRWDPGELITDVYDIPVAADADDGLYPLYTGFYVEETGDRLPVFDPAGNEIGTQVHVTDVRIGVE
jgi:4-amino-4-deoxy-L-arabinose transferase-like glycosyltransferase